MSPYQMAILKALTEAAAQHLPCPSNRELGGAAGGISSAAVSKVLYRLARGGYIRIIREQTWGDTRRVIEVIATQKKTSPSTLHHRGPRAEVGMPPKKNDPEKEKIPAVNPSLGAAFPVTLARLMRGK